MIGSGVFADADNDGLSDIVDTDNGGTTLTPPNTDGTGLSNYLDLDADDDGITDIIEAQSTNDYIAPSGNNANNNGLDDAF